ncbi:hypothetical protein [Kitasatospora arboriphila]
MARTRTGWPVEKEGTLMSGGAVSPSTETAPGGGSELLRLTAPAEGPAGGRIDLAVEATGEFRVERVAAGGRAFRSGRVDRVFLTRVVKALSSAAPGNAQVTAGTDAGSTPARRLFATGMPSGVDAVWDDAAGVPVPGIARALEVLAAQVLDPAAAGLLPSSLVQLDQPEPDPAEPTAGTGLPAAAVGFPRPRPGPPPPPPRRC